MSILATFIVLLLSAAVISPAVLTFSVRREKARKDKTPTEIPELGGIQDATEDRDDTYAHVVYVDSGGYYGYDKHVSEGLYVDERIAEVQGDNDLSLPDGARYVFFERLVVERTLKDSLSTVAYEVGPSLGVVFVPGTPHFTWVSMHSHDKSKTPEELFLIAAGSVRTEFMRTYLPWKETQDAEAEKRRQAQELANFARKNRPMMVIGERQDPVED